MSHSSKIFEEAPIRVPNRNGFDLSHLHIGSAKTGQLMPCMCKLLPPNTDFTLGVAMQVELPPLATAFFGRIDAIVEGFVVPCSILYGGWKKFIMNNASTANNGSIRFELPFWNPITRDRAIVDEESSFRAIGQDILSNDDILDALGYRVYDDTTFWDSRIGTESVGGPNINVLPFLAYHLIWDTYYRNKNVTKSVFDINADVVYVDYPNVSRVWHSYYQEGVNSWANFTDMSYEEDPLRFSDGVYLWQTRQRNYARDYFTAASVKPQQGDASALKFNVDSVSSTGEFTIASLRNANAIQQYLERNNISQDYSDLMRNRWGTRPIDADFDEPYYLGRCVVPVYQKSVYQQDSSASESAVNPFAKQGAIGVRGASASFTGEGSICGKFHNSTWSYVFCIFSLVPHAMYAQGVNRELQYLKIGDFPAPELQATGYDGIWEDELFFYGDNSDTHRVDIAYIPRYSRFKYMDDEISHELRAGRSLQSFALQRVLASESWGTEFLEIGKSDLDDVFAVSTENMNLSCWYELFFEFKVVMPLSTFCVPTLGDLQDSHYQKVKIGGSKL